MTRLTGSRRARRPLCKGLRALFSKQRLVVSSTCFDVLGSQSCEADMRRREFIGLVSAACLPASPFVARAQRAVSARVGFLGGSSSSVGQTLLSCFLSGLGRFGWIEGRDFKLEVRWTEGIVD